MWGRGQKALQSFYKDGHTGGRTKMPTREGPQLYNRLYSLCALPCGHLYTKLLHVQSRSMFLIPGHRI